MAKFVLATFGSYGDVYPYLAVGRALRAMGHEAVIAAPEVYRKVSGDAGLDFHSVGPDVDYADTSTFQRVMDPKRGPEIVVREMVIPKLRESYQQLQEACLDADLLASHVLTYAGPILGEKTGLPWVSTVLSPMIFASAYDPPAFSQLPGFAKLRALSPRIVGPLWRLMKKFSWSWSRPIREFRQELGLPADEDPLWEGQHSPRGVLVLFSEVIAQAQPDWPDRTTVCGFPFYDVDFGGNPDQEKVDAFLRTGAAPVVFSMGSSAVHAAGEFYARAARATAKLGLRAVLIVGDSTPPSDLPKSVIAIRSAELPSLFAASHSVVHAGGIGSVAQVVRAGRPQIVIPVAHDHFDNGLRVSRLGLGSSIPLRRLTEDRLCKAIAAIGESEAVAIASQQIRRENGAQLAAQTMIAALN